MFSFVSQRLFCFIALYIAYGLITVLGVTVLSTTTSESRDCKDEPDSVVQSGNVTTPLDYCGDCHFRYSEGAMMFCVEGLVPPYTMHVRIGTRHIFSYVVYNCSKFQFEEDEKIQDFVYFYYEEMSSCRRKWTFRCAISFDVYLSYQSRTPRVKPQHVMLAVTVLLTWSKSLR
ncbi:uncharacterized protein LOC131947830 [Physella acuta]|uniref:uncharacterized protein LOC131947830 n=1 Tax=Physella acuta TaxID=109671 RepID=UPI0027DDAD1F|nr:uncharacterized protein LOC131947830 [Physella acuta]